MFVLILNLSLFYVEVRFENWLSLFIISDWPLVWGSYMIYILIFFFHSNIISPLKAYFITIMKIQSAVQTPILQ